MQVLVVEDHERIAAFIREGLEEEGFVVHHAADGKAGLKALIDLTPDACVLDIMLPEIDGLTVLERARAQGSTTPILLLSAKGEVDDRVRGLELGADDYLGKPFHFEELVARLRALLRRGSGQSNELTYADVRIDFEKHQAFRGGEALSLTPRAACRTVPARHWSTTALAMYSGCTLRSPPMASTTPRNTTSAPF